MFKWKDGMLYIKKIDIEPIEMNIMSDLQSSYRAYVSATIHEDMQYLQTLIREIKGHSDITVSVRVEGLVQQLHTQSQVTSGIYYYPVYASFSAGPYVIQKDIEILRIPFMDDYGRVNFQGSTKVVLGVQRASDDVSYDASKNMFNIAMPHANIRIQATKKGLKLYNGRNKIPLDYVIAAMLYEVGDNDTVVSKLFQSQYISNTLKMTDTTQNMHIHKYMQSSHLLQRLSSQQYDLGDTREALNNALTLSPALGRRLSRDTCGYFPGAIITKSMLSQFVKQQIYTLYVIQDNLPEDLPLAYGHPYLVQEILAGTPNGAILRSILPQYAHLDIIPDNVRLQKPYIIPDGSFLTKELAELFIVSGINRVPVGQSATTRMLMLEQSILSNATARLRDLCDAIPAGRSADEWVYYYNNPNLEPMDNAHLTPHDFMGIASVMDTIRITGKSALLNRDTSYLKKILLVNEIFSETLQSTLAEFVSAYKKNISGFLSRSTDGRNPFFSLTKKWISKLNSERYTAPIDSVNILSEIAQANHVNTITSKLAAVPDAMRHLSMPFFGRICPFETSAGGKLGMVNTKAIGARIINGLLCAPYRKVIGTSKGIRISDKVTYLSVKEEIGYKFGDILTLSTDEKGNYLNTKIVAKIPNPETSDDPFIFASINAFELAGGYVSAYPEQFLSPSAAVIPFACSTDPVRISYGLKMLTQSIYIHHTQRPLVSTFMYSDIFKYSTSIEYRSACDGLVKSIDNIRMVLETAEGEVTVPIQGGNSIGNLDIVVEAIVKPGDRVRSDQLVAKAMKYPQDFVVRAPYRCQIIGISNDSIEIMKMPSGMFAGGGIDLEACDTIAVTNSRIIGQTATFLNIRVSIGDVVEKGDLIATTSISPDGIYSPARNPFAAFVMDGYNHEDGVSTCSLSGYNYTSLIIHAVSQSMPRLKYPGTRAVPLSGFAYCGDNDVIGTIVARNAKTPNPFEINVRASFKHKGIPFECTRADKDAMTRVYRWHLLDFKPLKEGDKMAGRHGNKGVVSKVHKNSYMPIAMNGKQVEFLFNNCGVPSRMNIGQIWECHLGLAAEVLGVYINSDPFNGASVDDVHYLMEFAHTLANTPDIENSRAVFDAVCSAFKELPGDFLHEVWKHIDQVVDWRGAFNKDGTARLYDPSTGTYFENDVLIGFPYYSKLLQEGEEKINFRSGPLSEGYSRTTSQPMKGDHSANGQRIGEMEFIALAAYGASNLIDECCNEKSDNIGARINTHCKQMGLNAYDIPDYMCTPRSVENTLYMLEGVGVHVDVPKDVCDLSYKTSDRKFTYDLRKLVQNELLPKKTVINNDIPMLGDLDFVTDTFLKDKG